MGVEFDRGGMSNNLYIKIGREGGEKSFLLSSWSFS